MDKQILKKWEENKGKLEEYFKTTPQSKFDTYRKIVERVFEIVINDQTSFSDPVFDVGKMTVLDHGHYQGSEIFIIPRDTYQPCVSDYIYTHNDYGSCSGCDTLQGIQSEGEWGDALATESQVKQYMTLSLHLIQRMKYLID